MFYFRWLNCGLNFEPPQSQNMSHHTCTPNWLSTKQLGQTTDRPSIKWAFGRNTIYQNICFNYSLPTATNFGQTLQHFSHINLIDKHRCLSETFFGSKLLHAPTLSDTLAHYIVRLNWTQLLMLPLQFKKFFVWSEIDTAIVWERSLALFHSWLRTLHCNWLFTLCSKTQNYILKRMTSPNTQFVF